MNFDMSVLDEFLEAFFQKLKKSSLSNFIIELHEFDFFFELKKITCTFMIFNHRIGEFYDRMARVL